MNLKVVKYQVRITWNKVIYAFNFTVETLFINKCLNKKNPFYQSFD